MIAIVSAAHHYVPGIEYTAKTVIESTDEVALPNAVYHHLFFGSDQLTAARVRSAQKHM